MSDTNEILQVVNDAFQEAGKYISEFKEFGDVNLENLKQAEKTAYDLRQEAWYCQAFNEACRTSKAAWEAALVAVSAVDPATRRPDDLQRIKANVAYGQRAN